MSEFKQGHALIVGVGADLPNTVDDAKGLGDILVDTERCAYPHPQVSVLTGEDARRTNVLTGLENLSKIAPDSNVVVYFSGHGYRVSEDGKINYYLMPYGYDPGNLKNTAISGAEFNQAITKINAKSILILLDCCHAGGFGITKSIDGKVLSAPPGVAKAPLPPEATQLFAGGSGRILIASSKETELSYAGKPYSAFTAALIEAFCGINVKKQDGYVRISDLMMYTASSVPERTKDKQHPIIDFSQASEFEIAYYAGGDSQPKAIPFTDKELIIENEPGESNPNPSIAWNVTNTSINIDNRQKIGGTRIAFRDYHEVEGNATIITTNVTRGAEAEDELTAIFNELQSKTQTLPDYQKPVIEPALKQARIYAEKLKAGDNSQENQDIFKSILGNISYIAPEFGALAIQKLSDTLNITNSNTQ